MGHMPGKGELLFCQPLGLGDGAPCQRQTYDKRPKNCFTKQHLIIKETLNLLDREENVPKNIFQRKQKGDY